MLDRGARGAAALAGGIALIARLAVRAWPAGRSTAAALVAAAGVIAGLAALNPGPVEAIGGNGAGLILGFFDGRGLCNDRNGALIYAGDYSRAAGGNTITIRHKDNDDWRVPCSTSTVLGHAAPSEFSNRATRGAWLLELRTAAGSGGQLISGGHISLPSGFTGARATGVHNRRSGHANGGGDDGDWPHGRNWNPQNTDNVQVYLNAAITFTVPDSHSGDVYLRIRQDGRSDTYKPYNDIEDVSFRFTAPLIDAYPLVAPQDSSGTPEEGDLTGGFARPTGGMLQRARLFLRETETSAYVATDVRLASADFGSAALKITSDAAGATAIANATITQSDGSSALSACTETTAGNECTITSANWPATGGITDGLDVWFQVPAAHTGTAYLVLSVQDTNLDPRRFAAGYFGTVVPAYPLAAPQNSGGTITTGTLDSQTRSWAASGASQRAAVFLRDADPSDEYDSSDTNVARSVFDSGKIVISSDPGGTRPIAGATIASDDAGAVLSACTESSAGNTCTITSGNWPEDSGTPKKTEQIDIYFTVPDTYDGTAYVSVTAINSGNASRAHWLEYGAPSQVAVYPLAAPAPGGTPVTWNIARSGRRFLASAGRQQVRLFLRNAAHGDLYESGDANAADSAFDSVVIKVAVDAAGETGVSMATISDSSGTVLSACDEMAAGNTCTILADDWPDTSGTTNHLDIWFAVPNGRGSPAWLTVTVLNSGNRARTFAVKYDPSQTYVGIFALVNGDTNACSTAREHQVVNAGGYIQGGTTTVLLNPRWEVISAANCARDAASEGGGTGRDSKDSHFRAETPEWKLALNYGPGDGTPISGAHIDLVSTFRVVNQPYTAGASPRSGSPINTRSLADDGVFWPWRYGHSGGGVFDQSPERWSYARNVTLSFTVPDGHSGPVYLYAYKEGSCRTFSSGCINELGIARRGILETTFVFQPGVAASPLAVPLSDAGAEETGELGENERIWAVEGGSQRVRVFPRAAQVSEYTASDANARRSDFDSITIRVATSRGGATSVTGAKISSDAAGNTAIAACTETAPGPVCTIPSSAWPQASSGSPLLTLPQDLYFSVPAEASGKVWLVAEARRTGTGASKAVFSLEYEDPYIQVWPFLAPAPGGTAETGNVQTGTRLYAPDAGVNRAKAYLRAAAHMDQLGSGLSNVRDSVFTSAVIRVATGSDGQTAVTGSRITQADGSSALSACTENTAGEACTIAAANWPATSGTTEELDLWFTVPSTVTTPVWLTLTLSHTGKTDRVYAIRYDQPLAAYPLPVPVDAGGVLSTDLLTATQLRAAGGTRQRARIFLREADHGNHYIAAHANIDSADLDSATIKLTNDQAGATVITGATISQANGSKLAACTEAAAGNTCTVTSANWPATAGTTTGLDVWIQVPTSHTGTFYLHVAAAKSGRSPGSFALEYGNPVAVYPLPVPQNAGGTPLTEALRTTERAFAAGGASQRARIYLRDASRAAYDASHANVGRGAFDEVVIRIASDTGGQNEVSGAKISSDSAGNTVIGACTESTVGPTCTITSANFPQNSASPPLTTSVDIHFSAPSGQAAPVYLVVTASKQSEGPRSFFLKYELPVVPVWPLPMPQGTTDGSVLANEVVPYPEDGAETDGWPARINLRAADPSGTFTAADANVQRSAFGQVVLRLSSDAEGTTPITGAKLSSDAAGMTALGACNENAVGHTCTIPSSSWPQATSGTPLRTLAQDIYIKLPGG